MCNYFPYPLCVFVQTGERLQSQTVEDCSSCHIEILNSRPPLGETAPLTDPEALNTLLPSAGSLSVSCVPDYCPQSVTASWNRPALQQITCLTNETYFHTLQEDLSEVQQIPEIKSSVEPSESLQEPSCSVIYGYISNETYKVQS